MQLGISRQQLAPLRAARASQGITRKEKEHRAACNARQENSRGRRAAWPALSVNQGLFKPFLPVRLARDVNRVTLKPSTDKTTALSV